MTIYYSFFSIKAIPATDSVLGVDSWSVRFINTFYIETCDAPGGITISGTIDACCATGVGYN